MKQQPTAVAILVLTTVLALSGCSLLEGLGPAGLTEPLGGRVVLPGAGIVVTFPDDWLRESPPSLASGGVVAVIEPAHRDLLVPLVTAVPPTRHDRCVLADIAPLVGSGPGWRTLEDVVTGFGRLLAADPRWVGLDSAILDLPAGSTGRITRAVAGESASVTTYVFTRPDGWFMLECIAQTVPPPDWDSVAATVEFLPAKE